MSGIRSLASMGAATKLGAVGPLLLAVAVTACVLLAHPPRLHAAAPTCTATATNAVGAHAGSLSIRVGVTAQCNEEAHLEFVLPGGAQSAFDTDPTGAFIGVVGDAYVCSGHPQPVAMRATSPEGEWRDLLTIAPEPGAPSPSQNPGPLCDVMLHPRFNYVTYTGPLATPAEAFASDRFSAVLPFGDVSSLDGAMHVQAVFELVPGSTPTEWSWIQWRPLAPAFVNQLRLLVPGHSYVILTDAELAWSFPAASSTP